MKISVILLTFFLPTTERVKNALKVRNFIQIFYYLHPNLIIEMLCSWQNIALQIKLLHMHARPKYIEASCKWKYKFRLYYHPDELLDWQSYHQDEKSFIITTESGDDNKVEKETQRVSKNGLRASFSDFSRITMKYPFAWEDTSA